MLRIVTTLMGCVIFTATTYANTSDIEASNNQIMFQVVSTYVDYTETGNGILNTRTGILDTETGWVSGIGISVSSMQDTQLRLTPCFPCFFKKEYFRFAYDYYKGETKYTGSLLSGGSYGSVVTTSSALINDLNLRSGSAYSFGDRMMLTPYLELGHHLWDRGVNYGETYTHKYYGLGALGQYTPVSKLVISANALIGRTFGSHITVNSGPVFKGFSGALGNSSLYKAGLSADYGFSERLHGNINIDYTSFSYGISSLFDIGGGYVAWEPDSTTKYKTVRVGLGYAY